MLADVTSNSSGRDVADACHDHRIKYGAVLVNGSQTRIKLAFTDTDRAEYPKIGTYFDV